MDLFLFQYVLAFYAQETFRRSCHQGSDTETWAHRLAARAQVRYEFVLRRVKEEHTIRGAFPQDISLDARGMAYGTLSGILHFWVLVLQWFGECCTPSAWRPQFRAHETFIMMRPEGLMPEGVRGTNTSGGGGGVDGKRIDGVSWQTWCVGVRVLTSRVPSLPLPWSLPLK